MQQFTMKKGHKGGTKYISISNADLIHGEVLLPGRHPCECEASKHALINNCLHCGRIVCEQEGSGPCFTCEHLVCSPKEQEQISRQSKAGAKLYYKLMSQGNRIEEKTADPKDSNLQTALQHRDKLLECDQTAEKRTKVIDDQNDYFQIDSNWLSTKERALLKKKKDEVYEVIHGRKKQTLTFDLAERKVIEEKPVINYEVEDLFKPDTSIFECSSQRGVEMPADFVPVYKEDDQYKKDRYNNYSQNLVSEDVDRFKDIRIQDRELQEMSDEGKCLSLHQPYASLLMAGIKKHEGRVWYTSYRGRLWIHAAGKVPSSKEIAEVQNVYKFVVGDCEFPKTYPSGCLLGCVDLVDCLPQEEYKNQFSNGEIASPYVFICDNPQELNLKFPMNGKHKIFKLENNIHQAAKKTLRKLM